MANVDAAADTRRKLTAQADAAAVELMHKYGEGERQRIDRGLKQVLSLWHPEDGDVKAFALAQFVPATAPPGGGPVPLGLLLARFETSLEAMNGGFNAMARTLAEPSVLDRGPLLPVDELFNGYDPGSHRLDDLFQQKIAFVALLNFPLTTLEERSAHAAHYSREDWAQRRVAETFAERVPASVISRVSKSTAEADLYIAQYNVQMHHLLGPHGERPFPLGMKLISHWNLRDELRADFADNKTGELKQKMILKVMDAIVRQTVPRAVINDPRLDWNPFTNEVTPSPAAELEKDAPRTPLPAALTTPEPNTRYEMLRELYLAQRAEDPYTPTAPDPIARSFESREIPEARLTAMLEQILTSPLLPRVAKEVEKRLGRPLEPQDLWYDGFQPRGTIPEEKLDALTKKRYPTAAVFARDLPRILTALGFTAEKAKFLAAHIVVDPSRGAGHALPASMRGDFPHLRTRVGPSGMDYKGYNIAIHELGHTVEEVFSLYEVDHPILAGVPNNAFTEALAFVFQARDLAVLGVDRKDPERERLRALDQLWTTFEISAVAMVDLRVWHWMEAHAGFSAAQLKDATVQISIDTWNQYAAPLFGVKDATMLGVYSHMVSIPLYLPDYPLGRMIAAQVEQHISEHGPLGQDFERMAQTGNVGPDTWMIAATGAPVGPGPLLDLAAKALAPAK